MDKELLLNFIQHSLPVPTQTASYIADQFDNKVILKNDYFLEAGTVSNDYLFLADGFMRAFTYDADGNDVTTAFYTKNRIVLEASSFFMRTVSAETIQALTDCTGFSLSFDKLNRLFHSVPEFREFGRAMLVRQLVALKQRTLSMINKKAEERYVDLFESNRDIFQHAQLRHIASYLGVTDTSLSRIRRDFSKNG
ncbi:Crp/Fnr family transcriptional regulator [Fibrella sp. HMF5405]|uniref:Crp/Fnr family transcriptional regulator n=2 Tax=Fibrella forsythiae TaxID=2817061 RepID=A0ABS3JHC7_9BACT|nr:Crp/Fnr family transcriptional regulator [Fibrella forsythiae]